MRNSGVFKGKGRRQRAGEILLKLAAQLKRHQRIHAQLGKTSGRFRPRGQPQNTRNPLLELTLEPLGALAVWQRLQFLA